MFWNRRWTTLSDRCATPRPKGRHNNGKRQAELLWPIYRSAPPTHALRLRHVLQAESDFARRLRVLSARENRRRRPHCQVEEGRLRTSCVACDVPIWPITASAPPASAACPRRIWTPEPPSASIADVVDVHLEIEIKKKTRNKTKQKSKFISFIHSIQSLLSKMSSSFATHSFSCAKSARHKSFALFLSSSSRSTDVVSSVPCSNASTRSQT
jgi:hypothetical protein